MLILTYCKCLVMCYMFILIKENFCIFFFWNTKEILIMKRYYSVHFYCFGKDLFVIWCIQYWWNSDYGLFCCNKHEYFHFVKVWCATDKRVSEMSFWNSTLQKCKKYITSLFKSFLVYIFQPVLLHY